MDVNCPPPPSRLLSQGKLMTKPQQIADAMNTEYIERNNSLSQSIPDIGKDPLENYKKAVKTPNKELDFNTLNMHDLRTILKGMKPTPTVGYDNISMKTLKTYQTQLEPLLLNMLNRIILTQNFPQTLKTSKIIPIIKVNKDPLLSLSWRPINLLPALSKIVEKTLLQQILKHMDSNKLHHHSQHGSTKGKSTITALNEIQEQIKNVRETKTDAVLLTIDQSLAFDIVSHDILFKKMKVLAFSDNTINLLRNYLGLRSQLVQVNAHKS